MQTTPKIEEAGLVDPAVIDLTLQTVKPLLKCLLNRLSVVKLLPRCLLNRLKVVKLLPRCLLNRLKANKALLEMNRTILN